MTRRHLAWPIGIGVVSVGVLTVVAVVEDVTWNVPLVLVLVLVAVLPTAKAIGRIKARRAGQELRERREG